MEKPGEMLGMPKAPASKPEADMGELEDAMSDLGEALAAKDWSAAGAAFHRAFLHCESDYEAPTDEG